MKRILTLFLLIILLSLPALSMSLKEAKEIALKNNRALKSKELSYESARWSYYESAAKLFPKLSVSGTYTEYDPDISIMSASIFQNSAESYGFNLTQPVFNGGALFYGSRIQKKLLTLSEYDLKNQRISTITGVEQKYLAVLESRELLDAAQKDFTLSKLSEETAEIKYNLGSISKADYLNVRSQTASKEITVISRENQLKINKLDLANYLQVDDNFEVERISFQEYEKQINKIKSLTPDKMEKILEELINHGLEYNPTVKISELNKEIKKNNVAIARSSLFPAANLAYSQKWDKADYEEDFDDQGVASLTVTLPIFSVTSNVSKLKQAKNNYEESKLDDDSVKDTVRLQIKQQFYNLVTAARSVHSSMLALEFAQETYDQMEVRYQNNMVSTQDLLDAELLLINTKNQNIISFYNYLKAKSALLQLLGEEDEAELFQYIN